MDGTSCEYELIAKDVLEPTAVEEMVSGAYDLTLFACTPGGAKWIVIFCNQK